MPPPIRRALEKCRTGGHDPEAHSHPDEARSSGVIPTRLGAWREHARAGILCAVEDDAGHYLRSFGLDVLAEFEHGDALGVVHATMVRPFTEPDAHGNFENGEFWGLIEFYNEIGTVARERLGAHELVRLRTDPDNRTNILPVASVLVEPVQDVRGDRPRWLVIELRE